MKLRNEESFKKDLEKLININSIDADTNTPDFILAEMLVDFIKTVSVKIKQRDAWFGADHEG